MDFAIFLLFLFGLLVMFLFRHMIKNNDTPQIKPPSMVIELGPLRKPLVYAYFIFSVTFAVVAVVVLVRAVELSFDHTPLTGKIEAINCSYKSNYGSCSSGDKTYVVAYNYKGTKRIIMSGPFGTHVKISSGLVSKNLLLGSNVMVYVGKIFNNFDVISGDILYTDIVSLIFSILPIILLLNSWSLLKKKAAQ